MDKHVSLKIISWVSFAGLLFSGYLSYTELVKNSCAIGGCSFVLGAPACVYGFVMYLVLFIVSVVGLKSK